MNWAYSDAMNTADRHAFFKYMVKTLAEARGLRATFMPKPFAHLSGNGCHVHVSLWDLEKNTNLFREPNGELGLSRLAYEFMGGLLHHAEALSAFTNPTVNSFKRINGAPTLSGATWSPNTISYTGNNRTHMIRIPDVDRFELRLADGATNPYLLQAAVLACGLDGITQHRDPGRRRDNNMYTEHRSPRGEVGREAADEPARRAARPLRAERGKRSRALSAYLFIDAYLKLKEHEWHEHHAQISPWERQMDARLLTP